MNIFNRQTRKYLKVPSEEKYYEFINDVDQLKIAVQKDPNALQYIENQTREICILALNSSLKSSMNHADIFAHIKDDNLRNEIYETNKNLIRNQLNNNQDIKRLELEEYKFKVDVELMDVELLLDLEEHDNIMRVKENWENLQFVSSKNQTEEICKLAIRQNADALQYVINQTDDICKLAILQDCYTLKFVHNQTIELCILACIQEGKFTYATSYIRDEDLRKYVRDEIFFSKKS